jgi:hypothetical protein
MALVGAMRISFSCDPTHAQLQPEPTPARLLTGTQTGGLPAEASGWIMYQSMLLWTVRCFGSYLPQRG